MENLFAIYFAGLVGWRYHPGYQREGANPPSLEECAMVAELMVEMTEAMQCRGSQQAHQ